MWPPSANRMVSALLTGLGKSEGSRMIALGTRSADPSHWFSAWLGGDADVIECHDAGDLDPMSDEAIAAANPSLEAMPALRDGVAGPPC